MKDMNKAMKKLQESKRANSAKLAKLVKESVIKEDEELPEVIDTPEVDNVETESPEVETTPETEVETKFNYKVILANGKEVTVSCDKENLADAKASFAGKTYMNTTTGERSEVVDVVEVGDAVKESKSISEEFGSKAKELNDNDPAQKAAYDSDAEKGLETAAKQTPKIVAEEFGSEAKELNDNDPAQNKPFESETKEDMANATKGNVINDKINESVDKEKEDRIATLRTQLEKDGDQLADDEKEAIQKEIDELEKDAYGVKTEDIDREVQDKVEEVEDENKMDKAKELIEVIFGMDSLEETREAAKRELSEMITPKETEVLNVADSESAEEINESKEIVENKKLNESDENLDSLLAEILDLNEKAIKYQNTDPRNRSLVEKGEALGDQCYNKLLELVEMIGSGDADELQMYLDNEPSINEFKAHLGLKTESKELEEDEEELEEEKPEETAKEIEATGDVVFEDIDDESFTEAFTRFVKETYKNAKAFKLESVKQTKEGFKFECKLTFKSGKTSNVIFDAKGNLKEGKSFLRFYENKTFKHENAERSIMTATVKIENKVLSCKKLRYNFTTALNESKVARVCGLIK